MGGRRRCRGPRPFSVDREAGPRGWEHPLWGSALTGTLVSGTRMSGRTLGRGVLLRMWHG
ncbi:hypothetical protein chiPu_0027248, partial [Chiloscyllium punctatum]|nr:hypothetical protein [Chiloscyllium punctatum]